MLRNSLAISIGLAAVAAASYAQQNPQVKVNVLNVCTPSAEEQQEISSALSKIPRQSSFTQDFEIDRGRSTLDQGANLLQPGATAAPSAEAGTADWVRIRHEYPSQSSFASVQYSFSRDVSNMVETLVFRMRDPKDLMQIAIEASASAVTSPAAMLSTDTPASRIKLERFGKSSVVLARCSGTDAGPPPDQTTYEPLFRSASAIAAGYRSLLRVRQTVPEELARVSSAPKKSPKAQGSPKSQASPH